MMSDDRDYAGGRAGREMAESVWNRPLEGMQTEDEAARALWRQAQERRRAERADQGWKRARREAASAFKGQGAW